MDRPGEVVDELPRLVHRTLTGGGCQWHISHAQPGPDGYRTEAVRCFRNGERHETNLQMTSYTDTDFRYSVSFGPVRARCERSNHDRD
jgi:hypothetical protein